MTFPVYHVHAVDEATDTYRTYCGVPCGYHMKASPNPEDADCPGCVEERQARKVERALVEGKGGCKRCDGTGMASSTAIEAKGGGVVHIRTRCGICAGVGRL